MENGDIFMHVNAPQHSGETLERNNRSLFPLLSIFTKTPIVCTYCCRLNELFSWDALFNHNFLSG